MKPLFVLLTLMLVTSRLAVSQKNQYNAGGSVYVPLSIPIGDNHSKGFGVSFSRQHFFRPRWSFDINAGYIYFSGEITDWDGNKQDHFALFPATIGARYYMNDFFAGLHAGFALKGSSNTATNLLFTPFIGYRLNKFQFSAKLLGIPQTFATYPEKTYLQKGSYSYIGFGVEYRVN